MQTMLEIIAKKQQDVADRKKFNLKVYVVGGGYQYIQMFFEAGMVGARNVEDADIICFTGGEDVAPSFYKEVPLSVTHFNVARDEFEATIFGEALALKKPMVGICRGAQFLNVMNGGRLWQDVNNHIGSHAITDKRTDKCITGMTSTHHQQMRATEDAEIIAVAKKSTTKVAASERIERDEAEEDDMEVLWYPDTLSLCFQPHPEFTAGPCRDYFIDLVDTYVIPAC